MKGAISISQPEPVLSLNLPFLFKMDLAPMEGHAQAPTELRFKPFVYSKQGQIKGVDNGGNCPGPFAPRGQRDPSLQCDDICLI